MSNYARVGVPATESADPPGIQPHHEGCGVSLSRLQRSVVFAVGIASIANVNAVHNVFFFGDQGGRVCGDSRGGGDAVSVAMLPHDETPLLRREARTGRVSFAPRSTPGRRSRCRSPRCPRCSSTSANTPRGRPLTSTCGACGCPSGSLSWRAPTSRCRLPTRLERSPGCSPISPPPGSCSCISRPREPPSRIRRLRFTRSPPCTLPRCTSLTSPAFCSRRSPPGSRFRRRSRRRWREL